MAENTVKKRKEEKAPRKQGAFSGYLSAMLDGTILTREKVESMLPFFLFMTALAVILIFNTYYAEKKARETERLRYEIVELRLRYITTKSELMQLSNQSEIARRLLPRGLVESTVPPVQISNPQKDQSVISKVFNRKNKQTNNKRIQ